MHLSMLPSLHSILSLNLLQNVLLQALQQAKMNRKFKADYLIFMCMCTAIDATAIKMNTSNGEDSG